MRLIRVLMLPVTGGLSVWQWPDNVARYCQIATDTGNLILANWDRTLVCGPHVCGHGPGPSNVLSVNNVPSTHHCHAHNEQIISVQFLVQRNAGPFPESYFILDWIAKLVNIRFYWPRNYLDKEKYLDICRAVVTSGDDFLGCVRTGRVITDVFCLPDSYRREVPPQSSIYKIFT